MKRRLPALALAALLLGPACAGPSEPPPSSIHVLDKSKLTAVEVALKSDAELASAGLQVSAKNDTCVLSGTVSSEAARKKAEELALRVQGITKVDNQLKVVPNP